MVRTILRDLIEQHIWANETLLAFCEGLTPDQLALTAPGTFGTVEETFAHLAANEEGYLKELAGVGVTGEMRTTIFDGEAPRTLASARTVLAKTAEAWRQVVTDWPENAVKDFPWEGTIERLPVSVFVGQAINHGTEHRAHIRTVLSSHGIEPPTIDFWAWSEATSPAG
jgi:uncharacterized damage-inducible protein DinB